VYQVLTDIIEKEVIMTHTDAVIILGDYFDKVFKANEENVSLAINVMSFLIRACSREKTKIRIVYGTESHEMSQYRLFNYHMTSKRVDMKLFTTATEEELFPNVHVLYVPEEYIGDKQTHYKDTLYAKHYDYIFGHGVIAEGMPGIIATSERKSKEKQVPHFKSKELEEAADLTVFGHYHIATDIDEKVHYVGSLFRWKFGEETPKGYAIIQDGQYQFVENPRAWTFTTYDYSQDSDIYKSEEAMSKEIDRIKHDHPDVFGEEYAGKIRMRFTVPKDLDPSFRDKLSSMLSNDNRIIPMFMNLNDVLMDEVKEEIGEEYDYIIDPSMPIYDKIHKYISMTTEDPISLATITKHVKAILGQ
jgi:hypothetical protein